ncbi:LysR family transcriptional regulator [Brevibacterium sp. 5221]|uniref:LysR family transcriptional regulator n=1 Tax=Brevibacterium rongguiense TaxID=2695267 RepID=A0A6N9H669_9MICO|nr:LysR substrate-binding domain-containing protein [Brevibacterium rongguiense]MYM19082.1 LysR family transcriptional regulator [Brevibacterium rongguiense]
MADSRSQAAPGPVGVPAAYPDPRVLALLDRLARLQEERGHASIGLAAREVGMAQPNASRLLRAFERVHGVYLLERSPRGSRLTERGAAVAAWAGQVMGDYDSLLAGLAALRGEETVHLRISASQTIAEYLLPGWLARFRAARPEAHVALRVANSQAVAADVRSHAADLGFIESPRVPGGVRGRVLGGDSLVVVARPDHPALAGPPLGAAALAAQPLLVREAGSGTRDVVDAALAAHGGPTIAAALTSTAALKVSAAAGLAPAALSALTVAEELRAGRLASLPLAPDLDLSRPLRALWPADRRPRGAAQEFLALASAPEE